MISLQQIDASLGLLGLNRTKLAETLGIKPPTFNAYFRGDNEISADKLSLIEQHLIKQGIEFIEGGVRIAPNKPIEFKGKQGFKDFYDDIYNTVSKTGGDICLYNAVSDLVGGFLGDYLNLHMKRMIAIKDTFRFRVILEEGDDAYLGDNYCEYKWYPKDSFKGNHFYVYGNKVAFVTFKNDDVSVVVISNDGVAQAQKELYDLVWERIAFNPDDK